ncbi:Methylthioribose-1-phosphate isomerase [Candidatus Thermoflexus japonica]|uniref:Methylthioribose-1-phosphate isomerase n=1 Tax=Candidatus Thermoflexus japonica TaxID=2035417 RepID=A0A2H5Y8F9_9CHLR|nr:Methylthioribose-1-phosphate isomerase [Candidatus Thermoflexus japonica]
MERLDWQEALKAYREDRTSGAMALAFRAAQIVEEWARIAPVGRMEDFGSELEGLLHALIQAHPDMAPPRHLAEAARRAIREASDLAAARANLIAALGKFRRQLEVHERAAARHAASLLRSARMIMTHSRSGLVARALAFAAEKGRSLQVICPVSEPGGEGQRMSEEVAAMGHTAILLPDLAAVHWLPQVDLVLVGADAWDEEGIVNKIGTLALAILARAFQRPFFVVAISEKRWPAGAGPHPARALRSPPRASEEIPWFEFVPRSYLTGLILEDGLYLMA